MFKNLFTSSTLLDLPLVVMFGFLALFVGVLIWVCSRRRSEYFSEMASLPLDDNTREENRR